ncbi:SCO6880 family protein [Demequina litorisediminis]|uniref:SCO6880 family protein n=1 Tax=Demequina litorisediminis TaxID=1849022 RepID=UPI0024E09673|nr:SCO6880 family protein [Demequina litorisediminis]
MSTALLFAALIATFLTVAIAGLLAGLAAMGVSAIAAGLVVTKNADHVSIIERVWERIMWAKTKATKRNVYRSGPLAATGWGRTQAPGVAAPLRLSEHVDSLGRPFALIYSPPGGLHTLVIETEPDGAALVDDEQIDQWVGSWGWWLSHLAGEPGLVGASVTVETAPDTGGRLGREVAANISGDAPQFARQVLADTVENYPAGSSVVRAYLALTFVSSTKKADRVGRELASRLPELTGTLASTGAGVAAPLDAARLCEVIRTAYDPAVASLIDEARMAGDHVPLEFSDVGPTAAEASWDSYRHDDATSRTWVMTGAPHGLISARGLEKAPRPSARHRAQARHFDV